MSEAAYHAALIREAIYDARGADYDAGREDAKVRSDARLAALTALVTQAEQAAELEREVIAADTHAGEWALKAEAAEARADQLQQERDFLLSDPDMVSIKEWIGKERMRADQLQRELDECRTEKSMCSYCGQWSKDWRFKADQLQRERDEAIEALAGCQSGGMALAAELRERPGAHGDPGFHERVVQRIADNTDMPPELVGQGHRVLTAADHAATIRAAMTHCGLSGKRKPHPAFAALAALVTQAEQAADPPLRWDGERIGQLRDALEAAEARADQLQRERDEALLETRETRHEMGEWLAEERARRERAETALEGLRREDTGCWCTRAELDNAGHDLGCLAARAALADSEEPDDPSDLDMLDERYFRDGGETT